MSTAARAFEQRSAAAVAQVVAEIDNGASVVPETPSSPALAAGGLDFRAAQISEDEKLAQELQREEYRKEEARTERRRARRAQAAAEENASWADWLMGTTQPANNAPSPSRGGARVAQPSSSIFSCVAQSVTSVMGPQQNQVRGVDSTSLL
eukprot:CAMPEP_0116132248 /NCGR_PEP_ID=MMETSP0329-20121206/9446_1 /TAXON_ID=697910 /ORGANISM="Pseudo-nitzschia arenysensis, Strain B593" /LENGTH=150 /DNA_ID=CAMNT_0003626749 /DNA_START=197 /DNA_END=649 /DNA_ORIENTATION=+